MEFTSSFILFIWLFHLWCRIGNSNLLRIWRVSYRICCHRSPRGRSGRMGGGWCICVCLRSRRWRIFLFCLRGLRHYRRPICSTCDRTSRLVPVFIFFLIFQKHIVKHRSIPCLLHQFEQFLLISKVLILLRESPLAPLWWLKYGE